ncbi:hypothetical protein CP533_6562 [Ophiocordyceps camponoti-saundersi (nom. inval.)]|nr:hypothetical protein CP533_6562 [Ophiocordyceps camponoti-saundersi (nom. inval.)]
MSRGSQRENLEVCDGDSLARFCDRQSLDLWHKSTQCIIRCQDETFQHGKAYQHMMHAFVVEKQYPSEALIKESHRALATGISVISRDRPDVPTEIHGGIYRSVIVGAGFANLMVPPEANPG